MQQKPMKTLKYVSRKETMSSTQIPTASECSEGELTSNEYSDGSSHEQDTAGVKGKLSLSMKLYWGTGGTVPNILNFGTR